MQLKLSTLQLGVDRFRHGSAGRGGQPGPGRSLLLLLLRISPPEKSRPLKPRRRRRIYNHFCIDTAAAAAAAAAAGVDAFLFVATSYSSCFMISVACVFGLILVAVVLVLVVVRFKCLELWFRALVRTSRVLRLAQGQCFASKQDLSHVGVLGYTSRLPCGRPGEVSAVFVPAQPPTGRTSSAFSTSTSGIWTAMLCPLRQSPLSADGMHRIAMCRITHKSQKSPFSMGSVLQVSETKFFEPDRLYTLQAPSLRKSRLPVFQCLSRLGFGVRETCKVTAVMLLC